jgi:predicted signal transduction protein with EAL and GGDEF domain
VNDTFGHAAGDALLQAFGGRLATILRASDTVARVGGDEFAVLLPGTNQDSAAAAAGKLIETIEQPFVLDGQLAEVGLSIGSAVFPDHGEDADTLQRHADVAMYAAKHAGGGYVAYTPERGNHNRDRMMHLSDLRQAIDGGELILHYQPKINCVDGRVTGAEALVRWQHPRLGLLGPDSFIPLAEQSGLIRQLTQRVLAAAIGQCRAWRCAGINLPVSVNVSMRDLHDPRLPELIEQLLAANDVTPDCLELEITESALRADPSNAQAILSRARSLGLKIAIDDFGSGYSCLTYLKHLPVDGLKIDRSFVRELATDPSDLAIVHSVVELGHNLGLKVVAEGVEDNQSWQRLAQLGCDAGQGYYLSRPAPATELESWLQTSPWGRSSFDSAA